MASERARAGLSPLFSFFQCNVTDDFSFLNSFISLPPAAAAAVPPSHTRTQVIQYSTQLKAEDLKSGTSAEYPRGRIFSHFCKEPLVKCPDFEALIPRMIGVKVSESTDIFPFLIRVSNASLH